MRLIGTSIYRKSAQELRRGNIIEVNSENMIIKGSEYNNAESNTAVVRLKLKNLLSGTNSEIGAKADDRYKMILLEKKQCTYSYYADPAYVFMDTEYNPYELGAEQMGEALNYLEDGMEAELVFRSEERRVGKECRREGGRQR